MGALFSTLYCVADASNLITAPEKSRLNSLGDHMRHLGGGGASLLSQIQHFEKTAPRPLYRCPTDGLIDALGALTPPGPVGAILRVLTRGARPRRWQGRPRADSWRRDWEWVRQQRLEGRSLVRAGSVQGFGVSEAS